MGIAKKLDMKSLIRVIAVVLLIAVIAGCFAGCEKNDVSSAIGGTWKFGKNDCDYDTFTFYIKKGNHRCTWSHYGVGQVISRYYGTYKIDDKKNVITVKLKNTKYPRTSFIDDLIPHYIYKAVYYSYDSETGEITLNNGGLQGVKR